VDILLVAISAYSISGYWWLLVVILLMVINDYFICGYFIEGYFWLFRVLLQLLVVILLQTIVGYFKLFHHKLLVVILL
jgi:hypothetical protein